MSCTDESQSFNVDNYINKEFRKLAYVVGEY